MALNEKQTHALKKYSPMRKKVSKRPAAGTRKYSRRDVYFQGQRKRRAVYMPGYLCRSQVPNPVTLKDRTIVGYEVDSGILFLTGEKLGKLLINIHPFKAPELCSHK
jgi:hypothetical protein